MKYLDCFKGRIAIVTGAGEGLGQSLCLALAEFGAIVVCTDKDLALAENTIGQINAKNINKQHRAFLLDVSDVEQISSVISKVYADYGRIDYLFNNAGIIIEGEIRDLDAAHWRNVININLIGLINCSSEAFKYMIMRKEGHIVNIASLSGLTNYTALSTPYAVSKHGVVTFSKALRLEALDFNVKVTAVCPGPISTKIGENMEHVNADKEAEQLSINYIRRGVPREIASEKILKGVVRNRKIIIFPRFYKVYYLVTSIFGFVEKYLTLKLIRNYRKNHRLQQDSMNTD